MSRRSGTRLFVGGLSYRVRERDLEKFFSRVGKVMDISMKHRYAFVEFDDHRDADDAVYELNGKELMGERVSVEKARGTPRGSDIWRGSGRPRDYPPRRRSRGRDGGRDDHRNNERFGPPTRTNYRLIVENLSSRVSWQDLKDVMRGAGEVTYADAHKQRKNEGVVEFASYSDMKNAIDRLDNYELQGRKIRLIEDSSSKRRRRSRSSSSRSRSRSHIRSKSRSRSSRSRSRSASKSPNRSRSKSASVRRSKSRSATPIKKRSRSNSATNHKRSKQRSMSDSPRRSRSPHSRERNGKSKSDRSGDDDD